jgi:hypothetical protein
VPRDGTSTIGFVGDWDQRGLPPVSPGSTDIQYRKHDGVWEIAEADIYLNASGYTWSAEPGKDTSLQAVLTHELGHALGLLHPCEPDGADGAPDCSTASAEEEATTMYPFYNAAQASLSEDDVNGICYLYPSKQDCAAGCGYHEMCVDGECRALCGEVVCAAEEACGFWGCEPKDGCLDRYCVGEACATSKDCGPLAQCLDGVCASGVAAWGDACEASSDCADAACVDKICQPVCLKDSECGTAGTCTAADDGGARGCVSSRSYEAGLRCRSGEDCTSGICIFTTNPAVCTAACTSSSQCAAGWSCDVVEGRQVCVPPSLSPGGGCSINPQYGVNISTAPLCWPAAFVGVLLAARRRRRHPGKRA